ncbi:MAG: acyl-CoA synthetase FdrA [Bacteroidales bacterium]|nr:acyl-CoA synthetase FdrA [Bacteroidales bacterium]
MINGIIKKGEYFDSVTLMIVSKEINKTEGVIDSSIVMGTNENKSILKMANLFIDIFNDADDTDLLICINSENKDAYEKALKNADIQLKAIRNKTDDTNDFNPKSFEGAIKIMPDANLSLISVAGKYATNEARKALNNGLHVMLFSDNVSIKDEIELKNYGKENGLLVMGPDCGTAIINDIPLAFANVVNSGNIGIVAASGTGLQEVSSIISNLGAGISQAIGTGGRDVKQEVGGIMFIEALKALNNDLKTEIILLVSKPPHKEVLEKIAEEIKNISKPVVAIFIGSNPETIKQSGAIPAKNLEEAAIIATALSKNENYNEIIAGLDKRKEKINKLAQKLANNNKGKYLRGLYSGGTLCDEAQLILQDIIGFTYSNTPLNPDFQLKDNWKSQKNTIVDLGEDEFTSGRPHPMIDYSLRNKRIIEEAKDSETAVILLDVVLGYGSNMTPAEELCPIIKKAKEISPNINVICSITGTDNDPQNKNNVKSKLENAGAIVSENNVVACELTGNIINILKNQ